MVRGTKTREEKYELWTYVQNSQKDIGICVPNPIKINCDKRHANADLNLMKTQTIQTLSEVKELQQVDTFIEIKKTINKQDMDVVK